MTDAKIDELLGLFRRRLFFADVIRALLVLSLLAAFATAGPLAVPGVSQATSVWLMLVLVSWLLLFFASLRSARSARVVAALLAVRRFEDAERELERVLRSVSVFRSTLLAAARQWGALLRARGNHAGAAQVFRAVVEAVGRRRRFSALETTTRILWADCELSLGNLAGAYEAFHPVFGTPLNLSERLLLLPIGLRYDLAAGHAAHAVTDLADKVRHAELLESPEAAWVHMMLAEACRRAGMERQADFLQRRAALYHDTNDLPTTLDAVVGEPLPEPTE